jgi:hypothetical protein
VWASLPPDGTKARDQRIPNLTPSKGQSTVGSGGTAIRQVLLRDL